MRIDCRWIAIVLLGACGRCLCADGTVTKPQFQLDVIPALTKAGCNSGACHGSFQGRGGFRLSLLGYDPDADYEQIVLASRGRRIEVARPKQSLLLQKATANVPHGGGLRMEADSETARVIERFIGAGAARDPATLPTVASLRVEPSQATLGPGDAISLRVTATWTDGASADVTRWALFDARDETLCEVSRAGETRALAPGKAAVMVRYQGQVAVVDLTVRYPRPAPIGDFQPVNFVDELALDEWRRIGVAPAARADDHTFVRRLYGDLIGTLPTPEETRRFVASNAANKRELLIDDLLQRPEYADYWSVKWGDLLRVHRRYVGEKGLEAFAGWIKQKLRENRPVTELARELLTARGNLYQSGPVSYFFVDGKPEELAETTAQVFLGVRLQCAKCHHHPMEVWSQGDYYGLAAFFTKLEVKQTLELGNQGRYGGIRLLRVTTTIPESRKLAVDAQPRVLEAARATPSMDQRSPPDGDVRWQLADWIVAPGNRFFARNFANRYWSYLFGIGLVEPVDDLRDSNPASMPALLNALSDDFTRHDFDVQHLLRTICRSRLYQLAPDLAPRQDVDGRLFTFRRPRQLPAEVLLDAVNQITDIPETFPDTPPGTRAIQLLDPTIPSEFLTSFGRPPRNSPCECARPTHPNLAQALQLLNSDKLQTKLASPHGRLARLLQANQPDAKLVEELYLACYSRMPSAAEMQTAQSLLAGADAAQRKELAEDFLWSLLNTAEFVFSH